MAICDLSFPAGVTTRAFDNPEQLAEGLARDVAERLRQAITTNGQATLVVSGGRSPVAFFKALAQQPLDWPKVLVSLADERWVPVEHADSNEGLVKQYLLQGPAAAARFLGLYQPADSHDEAAQAADHALAALPVIDVLILGMGEDGHTASLFPGSPNLHEALRVDGHRRCLPMQAPSVPHERLTLTRRVLAAARSRVLSVSGQGKLDTLRTALAGDDVAEMPIRAFFNPSLDIYWCP